MTKSDNLKVAVLAGGVGSERQVSLQSGQTVYHALQEAGLETVLIDFTPADMSILDDGTIDVFFLIFHGQFGEDGQVQKILEDRKLCFTGSGSESSRIAFNKQLSKDVFAAAGLPVAGHLIVGQNETEAQLLQRLNGFPAQAVVKPLRQGSSVGVEMTNEPVLTAAAAMRCMQTYGDCMIEEFVKGREITVGILNGRPLPIIEIRMKGAFYDFHSKYIDNATEYLFDTIEGTSVAAHVQEIAVACFNALGCRHLSRVDFILTPDGKPYILEINTLPGFTSHSLLPMAARKAGIATSALCRQIAEAAWNDFHTMD
jgi:D-alanine-D-alanine ligase